jgi:hypothetical protein
VNFACFDTQTDNSKLLEFYPAATPQAVSTADAVDMSGFEIEINARIAVRNESWEFAAWGKNLGDESYNAEHIVLLPFLGALYRAAPRQYGLEVSYRF